MTYAHINAFKQFVLKLDDDIVYCRQLTDTGELGVLAENGMKSRVTHDRKVSSAENGAELAKVLYRHAERADADIWMAMLVKKRKLVAKSDTFTVDQTQSCMQLLREMVDDFPDDVKSVVKDGAKARKPHTYAAYLVNSRNASPIEHGQLSTVLMWMMSWR